MRATIFSPLALHIENRVLRYLVSHDNPRFPRGHVESRARESLRDSREKILEVLAARREIEPVGIDDEERRVLVMEEEMVERVVQVAQVLLRDPLLEASPAPADPVDEGRRETPGDR